MTTDQIDMAKRLSVNLHAEVRRLGAKGAFSGGIVSLICTTISDLALALESTRRALQTALDRQVELERQVQTHAEGVRALRDIANADGATDDTMLTDEEFGRVTVRLRLEGADEAEGERRLGARGSPMRLLRVACVLSRTAAWLAQFSKHVEIVQSARGKVA